MNNKAKRELNEAIDKQIKQAASELLKICPEQDVELMLIERLLKKRGSEIRHSEIDSFKQQAIESLGTEHEIKFNDAELGFLQAALTDGRAGFKEFIENIPVEIPLCEDGTRMTNKGNQKKPHDSPWTC